MRAVSPFLVLTTITVVALAVAWVGCDTGPTPPAPPAPNPNEIARSQVELDALRAAAAVPEPVPPLRAGTSFADIAAKLGPARALEPVVVHAGRVEYRAMFIHRPTRSRVLLTFDATQPGHPLVAGILPT